MLLAENREVYLPAVDDHGVDLIVRTKNAGEHLSESSERAEFQEIQVKSLSQGGLFAAMKCDNSRPNYWFVFYIKDINRMWLINSKTLVTIASKNTQGKHIGKYSLDLKPTSKTPIKQSQFVITDFSKLP